MRAWSGNACEILDCTEAELAELAGVADPLISSLRDDAIELTGASPRRLLQSRVAS